MNFLYDLGLTRPMTGMCDPCHNHWDAVVQTGGSVKTLQIFHGQAKTRSHHMGVGGGVKLAVKVFTLSPYHRVYYQSVIFLISYIINQLCSKGFDGDF